MAVNKVILLGNVGKDPEVRHLESGVSVAKFTLATSEKYTNKSGEKVETTEWHNIVVWRKLAEIVEKYIKKGSQIYLEGKITTRSYEKDNEKKYFTEIVANNLQMLGSKKESNNSASAPAPAPNSIDNAPEKEDNIEEVNDDLPF
ncbi:MAG: single-stranded DNA-binding protein [Bacteroidales bacterium]|nr:single-stranded DNA-binding protein [Bacteroidales bacterium]